MPQSIDDGAGVGIRVGYTISDGTCAYGQAREVPQLRHTFCTRLAMAGQAPRTIQALAGHVSIETTMPYMHVTT